MDLTRRQSLGIAAAAAVPYFVPARLLGKDAPSGQIALGFIGVGGHGHGYNLKTFLHQKGCRAVAVCDTFASRGKSAAATIDKTCGTKGTKQYADFRRLLADKTIDAVVISTPDHWHVPMSLLALAAGKNVMCEKPSLTIAQGRTLVETVTRHKAVFQTGLEDRSIIHYHTMCEIVRNGGIGTLHTIRVKLVSGQAFPLEKPAPVPADLDWNLWTGPAPMSPYTPNRTGKQQWRNIRDYSGGKLADWGAHLLDTAQVGALAEQSGPVEVEGHGKVPKNSMSTMPSQYKITYRYASGVVMHVQSGGVAIRFEGDKGWVGNNGWRGRLQASDVTILKKTYDPATTKIWPRPAGEHRTFLDCIASGKPTTYTAEALQRLSTVMHIANISMWLGRKLKWDPKSESFPGDDAANALRARKERDWANA